MATDFTNQPVSEIYKTILHTDDVLTSAGSIVYTGDGVATTISLSTQGVSFRPGSVVEINSVFFPLTKGTIMSSSIEPLSAKSILTYTPETSSVGIDNIKSVLPRRDITFALIPVVSPGPVSPTIARVAQGRYPVNFTAQDPLSTYPSPNVGDIATILQHFYFLSGGYELLYDTQIQKYAYNNDQAWTLVFDTTTRDTV